MKKPESITQNVVLVKIINSNSWQPMAREHSTIA